MKHADLKAEVERFTKNLKPCLKSFLMPVFEAVNNGLYSYSDKQKKHIHIEIDRSNDSFINEIKIIDAGIGLDRVNFEAFRTPYTGHRLKKGGKGIGRFIGHAVFNTIMYNSVYMDSEEYWEKSFVFSLDREKEFTNYFNEKTKEEATGTVVTYKNIKKPYLEFSNAEAIKIREELCLHFLSQLASNECEIIVKDGSEDEFSLSQYFSSLAGDEFELPYDLKGKINKYYASDKVLKKNSIFFIANDRVVEKKEDVNKTLGREIFTDKYNNKYAYGVVVYGEFLDERVNQVRTSFNDFSETERREITSSVAEKIKALEEAAYQDVKQQQQSFYDDIININPSLKTVDFSIDKISPSMTKEQIAQDLLVKKHRNEEKAYKKFSSLLKAKEIPYEEFENLVEGFSLEAQAELAHYIAYRERIIQGLSRLSETRNTDESRLHNIISPYGKNNPHTAMTVENSYAENNLWLLDDRFMAFSKVFSDEKIKTIIKEINNESQNGDLPNYEPDMTIFYNEIGEDNYKDIVLIEFKACGAKDRAKVNSIAQINTDLSYFTSSKELEKINNFWGYIITDFDERTIKSLKAQQGLQELVSIGDEPIFYYYNPNLQRHDGSSAHAHIYILSLKSLLSNAEARNKVFMNILSEKISIDKTSTTEKK